jgi:hypothetical protein
MFLEIYFIFMFLLNLFSVIFNIHLMRFFNLNMKYVIVHIYTYSYVLPFFIVFDKEFLFSCRFILHLYIFIHSHGCIHCIFSCFLSVFSEIVINIILDPIVECVFIYTVHTIGCCASVLSDDVMIMIFLVIPSRSQRKIIKVRHKRDRNLASLERYLMNIIPQIQIAQ